MDGVCVIPPRIRQLPPAEQETARIRYVILCAAAWYSHEGHLSKLSVACGWHSMTVAMMVHKGYVAVEAAIKLEKVLGRQYFPREVFSPKLAIPADA